MDMVVACYEISCVGPYGSNPSCYCDGAQDFVIVQATDHCPECETSHFDLNLAAMNTITGQQMAGTCGIIETLWRRVSCPFQKTITIRSKSGTSEWWYALHVDDVAGYGAISSVALRQHGSAEFNIVCDKSNGPSFWLCHPPTSPIRAPLDVALVDRAGRILIGENIITDFTGDKSWDFGKNFDGIPTTDVPVASTTTAPNPTFVPTKSPTT
ncbi:lytic transglycosylase [Nitzschia inconspicua]|uniref:Lytic transglycosylase n=1 Tax=Nitzschia inconspicua TaxID=303405 RepID=A0A9K3KYF0_9STRA|nr:lytic transglycosylase [Nitzschia inconspicua]